MKKVVSILLLAVACCFGEVAWTQAATYPTHWWTGMRWNKVQVLVHAPNIGANNSVSLSYGGVRLVSGQKTESPNYYLVNLEILPTAKPGTIKLKFAGSNAQTVDFVLKPRRVGRGTEFAKGVSSSDLVYLIMPDRFSDGDPTNNIIPGYKDTTCDRSNPSAHHGGDIQGVMNKLPYLKNLGATSVWLCPVTENDMPWKNEPGGAISGYHGYWITNHYQIDKRYGGNAAYKKLVDEAHKQGMKIIQDAVYNHVGDEHVLYKDKPFADMFNNWASYTGSNHREEAVFSPYMSAADKKVMLDGWFTPHLPDVNQRNPIMANYLIQNVLWSTEEFGVDGWRVDTYKYCDEPFLNRINDAMVAEYPSLTVFGEAWCNSVPGSAYFVKNNMNLDFKHNLQGTTDFPMQSAMLATLNEDFGWTNGANKLFGTLSQDVLYKDPLRNCIFLDNHDMDRYVTMIGGDMKKYKMGMALLLTQRGIPQLYFGAEIFMKNDNVQGDGKKRNDFPGGFAGDAADKFTAAGRTAEENDAFNYVQALANFRKTSAALANGATHDYLPKNGLYVYFRKAPNQTVMVVVNSSKEEKTVTPATYSNFTKLYNNASNVVSGTQHALNATWAVPAQTVWVLELK
jgi:glycosidase